MKLSDYSIELLDPSLRDEVKPVSHSRLKKYLNCPRQYYEHYILEHKSEASGEMLFGKAIHAALEAHNKARIGGGWLNVSDTVDVFNEYLDNESKLLTKEEAKTFRSDGRDLLFPYFVDGWAEKLDPREAETEFLISIEGIPVYGVIDIMTKDDALYDYKSSLWPPRGMEAASSIQLSLYTLVFWKKYGMWPRESRLLYMPRKTNRYQALPGYKSDGRRGVLQCCTAIEVLKDFWASIQKERFLPIPGFGCQWCPYSERCPAVGGG